MFMFGPIVFLLGASIAIYVAYDLYRHWDTFWDDDITPQERMQATRVAIFILVPIGVLLHEVGHQLKLSDPEAHSVLIDWVRLPLVSIAQHSQPKADQSIASVAAASILAKVHRDRIMVELADRYPAYGFAAHKGYGAAAHLAALAQWGPSPVHRHTFSPIAQPATLFDLP